MDRALPCGAEQWDKRQRAEMDAQEAPQGHEEELLCCAVTEHWNPPERVGSPSDWRYSRSVCAVFSRMMLLEEGGGTR